VILAALPSCVEPLCKAILSLSDGPTSETRWFIQECGMCKIVSQLPVMKFAMLNKSVRSFVTKYLTTWNSVFFREHWTVLSQSDSQAVPSSFCTRNFIAATQRLCTKYIAGASWIHSTFSHRMLIYFRLALRLWTVLFSSHLFLSLPFSYFGCPIRAFIAIPSLLHALHFIVLPLITVIMSRYR
jgi:hypothetical protein